LISLQFYYFHRIQSISIERVGESFPIKTSSTATEIDPCQFIAIQFDQIMSNPLGWIRSKLHRYTVRWRW